MIKKNSVVSLSYVLTNPQGEELDKATKKDPFQYLHGAHQIVPGLESALEGLVVGEKRQLVIPPKKGYGELNPKLKTILQKNLFPKDTEVKKGGQFVAETGDGQRRVFTVTDIKGEEVHVDGNHPLAGETLHFDLEVLEVRDATDDELEHGHVHGPGGHHH